MDDDRELVLAYIRSRSCDPRNNPALPELVEELKEELLRRALDLNIGFSAVGVGVDWLPTDGWKHLGKYGEFDELIVGRRWHSIGARQFVEEGIVGPRVTPQVLVYERRKRVGEDMDTNAGENVKLARKLRISQIQNWVDRVALIPELQ